MTSKKTVRKIPRTSKIVRSKNRRRGSVDIDRWTGIQNSLIHIAHAFSKCEHDVKPIAKLMLNVYHSAFAHGVVATLHNTRRPRLRAIKYEVAPDTRIADLITQFAAEMMIAHPNHNIPVSRNN